jgi:hypothetical protein
MAGRAPISLEGLREKRRRQELENNHPKFLTKEERERLRLEENEKRRNQIIVQPPQEPVAMDLDFSAGLDQKEIQFIKVIFPLRF